MRILESAILMIAMDSPRFVPILIENVKSIDIFSSDNNRRVFKAISAIHSDNKIPVLPIVIERCKDLDIRYWDKLRESARGIPQSNRERFLLETISTLKWAKCKDLILRQIQYEVENPLGDPGKVIKLANSLKVIGSEKEDPDFTVADEEYKAWVTTEGIGIQIGFPRIDSAIDSFNLDELVVICGRPTTGKTMFAFNVIQHLMRTTPRKIALFSLEMPKTAVVERQKQIFFGLSRHELKEIVRNGTVRNEEMLALYEDLLLYTRNYSVAEMARIIDEAHIEIAFIDFLNIIRPESTGSRYEKTTQIILDLKRLAKDSNCLVIVLAQLSRLAGDGSIPVTMDMIRDSGAIEEVADFVIGLCRPEINEKTGDEFEDLVIINLLKNKRGRGIGCNAHKDPRTGRMIERANEPRSA